jgi:hypothetical protein
MLPNFRWRPCRSSIKSLSFMDILAFQAKAIPPPPCFLLLVITSVEERASPHSQAVSSSATTSARHRSASVRLDFTAVSLAIPWDKTNVANCSMPTFETVVGGGRGASDRRGLRYFRPCRMLLRNGDGPAILRTVRRMCCYDSTFYGHLFDRARENRHNGHFAARPATSRCDPAWTWASEASFAKSESSQALLKYSATIWLPGADSAVILSRN